jgi:hypothetical protein
MSDRPRSAFRGAHWLGATGPRDVPRDLPDDEHGPFARIIAGPLRTEERLAPDFEARLMTAVRRDASGEGARMTKPTGARVSTGARTVGVLAWWRRPRTLRVSPLGGLAVAAGFAGIVCLGTLQSARRHADAARGVVAASSSGASALAVIPATPPETVHVVRFVLVEPRARRVALVGDFNGWAPDTTPLAASGPGGVWTVSIPLRPGRHEYAFIVDGQRWVADPYAPGIRDDYATESSVIAVRGSAGRRT